MSDLLKNEDFDLGLTEEKKTILHLLIFNNGKNFLKDTLKVFDELVYNDNSILEQFRDELFNFVLETHQELNKTKTSKNLKKYLHEILIKNFIISFREIITAISHKLGFEDVSNIIMIHYSHDENIKKLKALDLFDSEKLIKKIRDMFLKVLNEDIITYFSKFKKLNIVPKSNYVRETKLFEAFLEKSSLLFSMSKLNDPRVSFFLPENRDEFDPIKHVTNINKQNENIKTNKIIKYTRLPGLKIIEDSSILRLADVFTEME